MVIIYGDNVLGTTSPTYKVHGELIILYFKASKVPNLFNFGAQTVFVT